MAIVSKQHVLILVLLILVLVLLRLTPENQKEIQKSSQKSTITPTKIPLPTPPVSHVIPQKLQVFQSFNNCGPATLSMALSYNNISASQEELGRILRPYQNREGDNDDKSVFLSELAQEANTYGLVSYQKRAGSVLLLKQLISHNFPVIVRTWLHPNEDIGHYRIVRGYDDTTGELIQDDSYQGKNLRFSYEEFSEMWQPFNYEYLIITTKDREGMLREILGSDTDESTNWKHAAERAREELSKNPSDFYATFNLSVAEYYLGKYHESANHFASIQNSLPSRMLWYQFEPIEAYLKLNQFDTVFQLTSNILDNNNRGYSELYLIRAEAYRLQGDNEQAQKELEKAQLYNINLTAVKIAQDNLQQNQPLFTSL